MNQLDIVISQYARTILELQARVAQAALELAAAQEELAELKKPKDAPKLEVVDNAKTADSGAAG